MMEGKSGRLHGGSVAGSDSGRMNRSSQGREVGWEGIPSRVDGACRDTETWKCKRVCEEQGRLGVGKADREYWEGSGPYEPW